MENINKKEQLQLVYGDYTFGVKGGDSREGTDFRYIFSYAAGGPVSFRVSGKEWLYRAPRPTFWRATTDNDRGNGFHLKSGMWLAADMFQRCTDIRVTVDGAEVCDLFAPDNNRHTPDEYAQEVALTFCYETITVPKTNVRVTYAVQADGSMKVSVAYEGKEGLPQLPAFGLRFVMPTAAKGYRYEGLSGETYPDRKDGGVHGIYEVDGLPVTPYLVPQECGMHMDTDWLAVCRDTALDNSVKNCPETVLCIESSGEKFAFSCLPYTAEELENATHQEELPPVRRTVLCVYGAVRGVGGINSWGADVGEKYQIDAGKDITFSFRMRFC
ncbi:beta-galactosidase [Lachnoclostridium sp. An169]|uniref:beta-galactosidase small subunit n=1 Tax=Lachnoclostridium sp. An169 TaxID=1965569 RepID=UPI000B564FD1|nr:beta-galactosidase small subunit [Lachnoclostridium sp. An169]OUP85140.1 beta-galactosidase [Lachnoclostridium sp. An169]HJA64736.1 beta-galactosidase small subunit [Candidatus Mediterraneibacter cottocaccae]